MMGQGNHRFSTAGLRGLREVPARHVECGRIPGLVALVDRGSRTHIEAIGTMRRDGGAPRLRHTVFRPLAVTALAAELLAEMRTPHPKGDPLYGRYGLGMFVQDLGPVCGTVLNHNGSPPAGYAALMYSSPDGGKTLTASLTAGDAAFDLAAYPKLLDGLVKAAFCGGQAAS